MLTRSISKMLSANDVGDTGGHQAGILVPKNPDILSFFPSLDKTTKNPRSFLTFLDDSEESWRLSFIYYNNKFFGGTRNEYRLTRMTPYMRENALQCGDELFLERYSDGLLRIRFERRSDGGVREDGVLQLGSSWKVIAI